MTREVLDLCRELGLEIEARNWGSPVNADSYERHCALLDGEIYCKTGNYLADTKGAWVSGAKAVYFLACGLGVKVRDSWKKTFKVDRLSMSDLLEELQARKHNERPRA